MNRPVLFALLLMAASSPATAQDADQAKAALDAARKAAKDAGVDIPDVKKDDIDKLVRRVAEEVEKAREKKDGEAKDGGDKSPKPGQDPEAPSIRIEKLPDWIPAIPGFTAAGLGRQWDGPIETGKLKGTSALAPAALAEAWMAHEGKGFSAERTTRTANGKSRETIKLTRTDEPARWVEMQTEPGSDGQPSSVRVTYAQPTAAPAAPAAPKPAEKPAE